MYSTEKAFNILLCPLKNKMENNYTLPESISNEDYSVNIIDDLGWIHSCNPELRKQIKTANTLKNKMNLPVGQEPFVSRNPGTLNQLVHSCSLPRVIVELRQWIETMNDCLTAALSGFVPSPLLSGHKGLNIGMFHHSALKWKEWSGDLDRFAFRNILMSVYFAIQPIHNLGKIKTDNFYEKMTSLVVFDWLHNSPTSNGSHKWKLAFNLH